MAVTLTSARRRGLAVLAKRYATHQGRRPEEQRCRRSSYATSLASATVYWQTADWLAEQGLAVIYGWDGAAAYVRLTRAGIELARMEGML